MQSVIKTVCGKGLQTRRAFIIGEWFRPLRQESLDVLLKIYLTSDMIVISECELFG